MRCKNQISGRIDVQRKNELFASFIKKKRLPFCVHPKKWIVACYSINAALEYSPNVEQRGRTYRFEYRESRYHSPDLSFFFELDVLRFS